MIFLNVKERELKRAAKRKFTPFQVIQRYSMRHLIRPQGASDDNLDPHGATVSDSALCNTYCSPQTL